MSDLNEELHDLFAEYTILGIAMYYSGLKDPRFYDKITKMDDFLAQNHGNIIKDSNLETLETILELLNDYKQLTGLQEVVRLEIIKNLETRIEKLKSL